MKGSISLNDLLREYLENSIDDYSELRVIKLIIKGY